MSDHVYIFPTDTVWGIGAALSSLKAKRRLEEIKRISRPRPYALIFAQIAELQKWLQIPAPWNALDWAQVLAAQTTVLFPQDWLLPAAAEAAPEAAQVGIRWQPNAAVEAIWQREQEPLISTSLNLTGAPPIVKEQDARKFHQEYAPDAIFQTASVQPAGVASTIIALTPVRNPVGKNGLKIHLVRGTLAPALAAFLGSMGLDVDGD